MKNDTHNPLVSRAGVLHRDTAQCPDFAEIIRDSKPDESLFEQIAACFSNRLSEFAKFYCRDESLGMDAFQDAMIAMMRYLDTYRGDASIEKWLRRIVVSSCSRLRRGKKNDPSVNLPFEESKQSPEGFDASADQELRLMLIERLELVQAEIKRLKEPNSTLLVLHDVEEVPISELAERFDMTEEAVKSRLKRSRAQVREQILARV